MPDHTIPPTTVTVALIDNHPHVVAKQGGKTQTYPCTTMTEANLVKVDVAEFLRTRRL